MGAEEKGETGAARVPRTGESLNIVSVRKRVVFLDSSPSSANTPGLLMKDPQLVGKESAGCLRFSCTSLSGPPAQGMSFHLNVHSVLHRSAPC